MSFELKLVTKNKKENIYKIEKYIILSLENLLVDVKHEFNADNKRLYCNTDTTKILAEGTIY